MNAPRTTREALIAEMLGDLDVILARVEALPATITATEDSITGTLTALKEAGDRYRMAVTAFNEQAKADLADYLDRKAAQTVDEQRAVLQDAARAAFRSEASDKAASLGIILGEAAKEFRRSMRSRFLEHTITAVIASVFTAGLVYVIFK